MKRSMLLWGVPGTALVWEALGRTQRDGAVYLGAPSALPASRRSSVVLWLVVLQLMQQL